MSFLLLISACLSLAFAQDKPWDCTSIKGGCLNNGVCVQYGSYTTCQCPEDMIGSRCQLQGCKESGCAGSKSFCSKSDGCVCSPDRFGSDCSMLTHAPGQYYDVATGIQDCGLAHFSPSTQAKVCLPVEQGMYPADTKGEYVGIKAVQQLPCPKDFSCEAPSQQPVPCADSKTSAEGEGSCHASEQCGAGFGFVDSVCAQCPAGSYATRAMQHCEPVEQGYYAASSSAPNIFVGEQADMQQACPLQHVCAGKSSPPSACFSHEIAVKGVECQPCELGHVPYLWKELEFCTPVKPGYYAVRAEKPYEYVKEKADMQQACPLMHACKGKSAPPVRCASFEVPTEEASVCSVCAAGQFPFIDNKLGLQFCTDVKPGYYAAQSGSPMVFTLERVDSQQPCYKGCMCPGRDAAPKKCDTFQIVNKDKSECTSCPDGRKADISTNTCTDCTEGLLAPPSMDCQKVILACPSDQILVSSGHNVRITDSLLNKPIINPLFPDATLTYNVSSSLVLGTHTVHVDVNVLSNVLSCAFSVQVLPGTSSKLDSISTLRRGTTQSEYLASASPLFPGSARLADMPVLAPNTSSFAVQVSSNVLLSFFPLGFAPATIMLQSRLQYCARPDTRKPLSPVSKARNVTNVGRVESFWGRRTYQARVLSVDQSRFTHDVINTVELASGCITISLKQAIASELLLAFKELTLVVTLAQSLGWDMDRLAVHTSSAIYIQAARVLEGGDDERALLASGDANKPTWVNCPHDIIAVGSPQNQTVFITWSAPVAIDDVELASSSGTHKLGWYGWQDLPLTVTYTAYDTSNNAGTCAFQIDAASELWREKSIVHTRQLHEEIAVTTLGAAADTWSALYLESFLSEGMSASMDMYNVAYADTNMLSWTVLAPEQMEFQVEGNGHAELFVDLELATHAAENITTYSGCFFEVTLLAVRDGSQQRVTLPRRWVSADVIHVSSAHIRIVGSSPAVAAGSVLLFRGVAIKLMIPAATRNEGVAYNYTVTDVSFGMLQPLVVASRALKVVPLDRNAPRLECRPRVTVTVASAGAVVSLDTADVDPIFVLDDEGQVTLERTDMLGSSIGIGEHVIQWRATDEAGLFTECVTSVLVQLVQASHTSSTSSSKSAMSAGAVSSIVIACLAACAFIAFALVWKRLSLKQYDFEERLRELSAHLKDKDGFIKPREIKRSALSILEALGEGNWGAVEKGYLEEHVASGFLVAVKRLKVEEESAKIELMREAAFMAQLNCDHIVKLHGVMTKGEPFLLVMEYCEHGSLKTYLSSNTVLVHIRRNIAFDAALALEYLAARGIVHRDVAARNMLLSSNLRGKLADFGMTRHSASDSDYYTSTGGAVPVRWSAPEALEEFKFSEKSDVWSWAVLFYECETHGQVPYQGMNNQMVWMKVMDGHRLDRPKDTPNTYYKLMRECWLRNHHNRPSFSKVVETMKELLEQDRAGVSSPLLQQAAARRRSDAHYVDRDKEPSLLPESLTAMPAAGKSFSSFIGVSSSKRPSNVYESSGASSCATPDRRRSSAFGTPGGEYLDLLASLSGEQESFGLAQQQHGSRVVSKIRVHDICYDNSVV